VQHFDTIWKLFMEAYFFNKIKTTPDSRLRGLAHGSCPGIKSDQGKELARDYVQKN